MQKKEKKIPNGAAPSNIESMCSKQEASGSKKPVEGRKEKELTGK